MANAQSFSRLFSCLFVRMTKNRSSLLYTNYHCQGCGYHGLFASQMTRHLESNKHKVRCPDVSNIVDEYKLPIKNMLITDVMR